MGYMHTTTHEILVPGGTVVLLRLGLPSKPPPWSAEAHSPRG